MSQDLRALLRDRKTKGRKLNATHDFCLSPDLLDDLEDLQSAREAIIAPFTKRMSELRAERADSLAGADTSPIEAEQAEATRDIDAQIAAKKAEIRATSVVLHFRALPGQRYEALSAQYNMGTPESDQGGFFAELLEQCFVKATLEGEATDLTWAEIVESGPNNGEFGRICARLVATNQVAVDIPFSLRRSGKTP